MTRSHLLLVGTLAVALSAGAPVAPAAAAAAAGTAAPAPEVRRYAVIVGNNRSLDEGVAPLSFADDDAVKYYRLFGALGADVTLLAVLDPDAQRRFPRAAAAAGVPDRRRLLETLAGVFDRIEADRAAGRETHFYFVYSGHGGLGPNREGYLNLVDVRFGRSDLYREVIARSPATFNHLVLDACHAYFFVHKRGGRPDREGDHRAAVAAFLRTEDLAAYPNTGVILAQSSESETHEWSRWEAGLFSHELRSALLGAGDVDGDLRVTYAEAAACVEAANAAIDDPRARLRVVHRPPAARVDVALLDLRELHAAGWLHIPASHAGRYDVEDGEGVRTLDLNSSRDQAVRVALVGEPPFFVHGADGEAVVPDGGDGDGGGGGGGGRGGEGGGGGFDVDVGALAWRPAAAASRGAVEATFRRRLYTIPFGFGFFRGRMTEWTAAPGAVLVVDPGPAVDDDGASLRTWGWTALGVGVAAGAAGGLCYGLAAQSHDEYQAAATGADARRLRAETERRDLAGHVLVGVGGALAVTGAALLIWDAVAADGGDGAAVRMSIGADGGGFVLGATGRF